jgi:hypothetical protein
MRYLVLAAVLVASPALSRTTDPTEQMLVAVEQVCKIGFVSPERMLAGINSMAPDVREKTKLMCAMYVRGAIYEKVRTRRN